MIIFIIKTDKFKKKYWWQIQNGSRITQFLSSSLFLNFYDEVVYRTCASSTTRFLMEPCKDNEHGFDLPNNLGTSACGFAHFNPSTCDSPVYNENCPYTCNNCCGDHEGLFDSSENELINRPSSCDMVLTINDKDEKKFRWLMFCVRHPVPEFWY